MTVAGGDARGHIAPYSNFGDAVDILAPGGDLSRDDNGDNNPDGVLSTKTAENCFDPVTGTAIAKCFYAYEQGTSMAAPHVSAALALMMSKRRDLSTSDLVARLLDGATRISDTQCSGPCSQYPGATPSADDPSIRAFIELWQDNPELPEASASCDGAIGQPPDVADRFIDGEMIPAEYLG